MIINYFDGEFIKIQFGDTTIAFNPISKDSKLKPVKFGADIAIISINHPDFNGTDQLVYGDRKPFVISNPGAYEIGGVFVKGFQAITEYAGKEQISTIYSIFLEGMKVWYLGALSNVKKISNEALEEAEEGVDVLIIPIGGKGVINASEAYKFAVNLEAKIIIPIDFNDESLKNLFKDGGTDSVNLIDKLTLKKKDLDGKQGEIIALNPSI